MALMAAENGREAVPPIDVARAWEMEDALTRTVFVLGESENPPSA
jgi:hypothetical protein